MKTEQINLLDTRDVRPHTGVRMPYHRDTDSKLQPTEIGDYSAPAIWMLDPFTAGREPQPASRSGICRCSTGRHPHPAGIQ